MTEFTVPPSPNAARWCFRPWVVVVCLLALAIIFGSCGMVAGRVSGSSSNSNGSGLKETLIDGDAKAKKKIVRITIEGMIVETMGAGGTVSKISKVLKKIEEDKDVVGVLLAVDTPGGGVTASDRIYHDIMEFKNRSKLPVHAMFYDVAASGGYYISMSADRITAHPTCITGSIGVISKFYNVSEAMDRIGVSVNVIKSLNSRGDVSFKDMGSPFRPMTPQERALIQGLITEMWDRFTGVVIAGRKGKMDPDKVRQLADGRVFTGEQALKVGLIDSIGYKEDAYKALRDAAKSPDAKIVAFEKEPGLKEMIGLEDAVRAPQASLAAEAMRLLNDQNGFLYLWTAGGIGQSS